MTTTIERKVWTLYAEWPSGVGIVFTFPTRDERDLGRDRLKVGGPNRLVSFNAPSVYDDIAELVASAIEKPVSSCQGCGRMHTASGAFCSQPCRRHYVDDTNDAADEQDGAR